ncbi:HNH endonuclease [Chelativorans xinjiangense]|uniref:HNH endonuclease n=1 Tax=Chelativorans xinjiangense TaxID=2681485 RepID=UPI00135B176D|nr:HNH endonuclease [Chelativorans xinjiangense]
MAKPTQARAREYFNYDPETGVLTFKERPREEFSPPRYSDHLKRIGKPAGCPNQDGYIKVLIDGTYHSAHRVIWLMIHGEWAEYPQYEIDHINGNRDDNRLSNLRKVTKSGNQRNSSRRINNTSGVHGVNWKPQYNSKPGDGRWVARIWNGPRHVYLGSFKTLHEAQIARKAAERVLGYTGTEREPYGIRKHIERMAQETE